jgi:hypothetical protein
LSFIIIIIIIIFIFIQDTHITEVFFSMYKNKVWLREYKHSSESQSSLFPYNLD